ncbi:cell division protein ZapA [Methylogaea oryzae]|uniref:Cell division protein ZapA n=1 Tax=Methylogaea oryzae TaxID=1295382 RepID=A0A8D5AIL0_9GAMM|nr:cell division protein ZapA [Methylogaea oryzae]BBL72643.1 cell division protein ZapA [Methylogaea oryzae]
MSEAKPVKVIILGKEFHIACREEERDDLMTAALHLDEKMRHIRSNSQIGSFDRIAVMAALNIAHELVQAQSQNPPPPQNNRAITERVVAMQERIDAALAAATPDDK